MLIEVRDHLRRWSRADHIVCSSDEIVEQLAAGLLAPSIDEILAFGDKSWISAVEVTSQSALIGVKTGEVSQYLCRHSINICNIHRRRGR